MNYRRLGDSGLFLSAIGLGSYLTYGDRLDLETSRRCIHAALDAGVNYFDTADVYADGEAERVLGKILGEVDRAGWTVGTKCFFPVSDAPTDRGLSRKHVVESAERSLRNLRVDHIDLFQCHRFDPNTPLVETIEAMDMLVRQGKILYWGMGRFSAEQISRTLRLAGARQLQAPVAHQTIYGLLHREVESEILPQAEAGGVGTLAYGALGQGVLTGKYGGGVSPPASRAADAQQRGTMYSLTDGNLERASKLAASARKHGMTPAQLALAWCLRRPELTTVIVGATTPDQVRENAAAAALTLAPQAFVEIERDS